MTSQSTTITMRFHHKIIFPLVILILLTLLHPSGATCPPGSFTYPSDNPVICGAKFMFGGNYGLKPLPQRTNIPFTIFSGVDSVGMALNLPFSTLVVESQTDLSGDSSGHTTTPDAFIISTQRTQQGIDPNEDNNNDNVMKLSSSQLSSSFTPTASTPTLDIRIYNLSRRVGIDGTGVIYSGTMVLNNYIESTSIYEFVLNIALTNLSVISVNTGFHVLPLTTTSLQAELAISMMWASCVGHLIGPDCTSTITTFPPASIDFVTTPRRTITIAIYDPIGSEFRPIGLEFRSNGDIVEYIIGVVTASDRSIATQGVAGTTTTYTFTLTMSAQTTPTNVITGVTMYLVDSDFNRFRIPGSDASVPSAMTFTILHQITTYLSPLPSAGSVSNSATCQLPLTFGPSCNDFLILNIPTASTSTTPTPIPLNKGIEFSFYSRSSVIMNNIKSYNSDSSTPPNLFQFYCNPAGLPPQAIYPTYSTLSLITPHLISGIVFFAHSDTSPSPLTTTTSCQLLVRVGAHINAASVTVTEADWSIGLPNTAIIPTITPTTFSSPPIILSRRYPYPSYRTLMNLNTHGDVIGTTPTSSTMEVQYHPSRIKSWPGDILTHCIELFGISTLYSLTLVPIYTPNGPLDPIKILAQIVPSRNLDGVPIPPNEYALYYTPHDTSIPIPTGYTILIPSQCTASKLGPGCHIFGSFNNNGSTMKTATEPFGYTLLSSSHYTYSPLSLLRTSYDNPTILTPFTATPRELSSSSWFYSAPETDDLRSIEYYDIAIINGSSLLTSFYTLLPPKCVFSPYQSGTASFKCNCDPIGAVGLDCAYTPALRRELGMVVFGSTFTQYQSITIDPSISTLPNTNIALTGYVVLFAFDTSLSYSLLGITNGVGIVRVNDINNRITSSVAATTQLNNGMIQNFQIALLTAGISPQDGLLRPEHYSLQYDMEVTMDYLYPLGVLCRTPGVDCLANSWKCPGDQNYQYIGTQCISIITQFSKDQLQIGFIDEGELFGFEIVGKGHELYTQWSLYHIANDRPLSLVSSTFTLDQSLSSESISVYYIDFSSAAVQIPMVYGDSYVVYALDGYGVLHNTGHLLSYRKQPGTTYTLTNIETDVSDRVFAITLNCPYCEQIYRDFGILLYYQIELASSDNHTTLDILPVSVTNPKDNEVYSDLYQFPWSLQPVRLDLRRSYRNGGLFILRLSPSTIIQAPITTSITDLQSFQTFRLRSLNSALIPGRCNSGFLDKNTGFCVCPMGKFGSHCEISTTDLCSLSCPHYQTPNPDCTECVCMTEICRQQTRVAMVNVMVDQVAIATMLEEGLWKLQTILIDRPQIELTNALGLNRLAPRLASLDSFTTVPIDADMNKLLGLINDAGITTVPTPVGIEKITIRTVPPIQQLNSNYNDYDALPSSITYIMTISMEPIIGADQMAELDNVGVLERFNWLTKAFSFLIGPSYMSIIPNTPFWNTAFPLSATNRLVFGESVYVTTATPLRQLKLYTPLLMTTCSHSGPFISSSQRFACPPPAQRSSPLWNCGKLTSSTTSRLRGMLDLGCDVINPFKLPGMTLSSDTTSSSLISLPSQRDCPLYQPYYGSVICDYRPSIPTQDNTFISGLGSFNDDFYIGEPLSITWDLAGTVISSANSLYYQAVVSFQWTDGVGKQGGLDTFIGVVNLSENPSFITPSIDLMPMSIINSMNTATTPYQLKLKLTLLQNAQIVIFSDKTYNLYPSRQCNTKLNSKCMNNLTCQLTTQQCGCAAPLVLQLPDVYDNLANILPSTQNPLFGQCVSPCQNNAVLNTDGSCTCIGNWVGKYCQIPTICNTIDTSSLYGELLPVSTDYCNQKGYDTTISEPCQVSRCTCINKYSTADGCQSCGIVAPYWDHILADERCDEIGTDVTKTSANCIKCICKLGYSGPLCQYRALLGTIRAMKPGFGSVETISDQSRQRMVLDMALSLGIHPKFVSIALIQQEIYPKNKTQLNQITFSIESSTRSIVGTAMMIQKINDGEFDGQNGQNVHKMSKMSPSNQKSSPQHPHKIPHTNNTNNINNSDHHNDMNSLWDSYFSDDNLSSEQQRLLKKNHHLDIFVEKRSKPLQTNINTMSTLLSSFLPHYIMSLFGQNDQRDQNDGNNDLFTTLADSVSSLTPSPIPNDHSLSPSLDTLYDLWNDLQTNTPHTPIYNTGVGGNVGGNITPTPGYDPVCNTNKATTASSRSAKSYINDSVMGLKDIVWKQQQSSKGDGTTRIPDDKDETSGDETNPNSGQGTPDDGSTNPDTDFYPDAECPKGPDPTLPLIDTMQEDRVFPTVNVVVSVVVIGGVVIGVLCTLLLLKNKKMCCFVPKPANNRRGNNNNNNNNKKDKNNSQTDSTLELQTQSTEISASSVISSSGTGSGNDADVESNTASNPKTSTTGTMAMSNTNNTMMMSTTMHPHGGIHSATCASNTASDSSTNQRSNNSAPTNPRHQYGPQSVDAPMGPNEAPLPLGWRRVFDPKSKKYFYINDELMLSSWTLPTTTTGHGNDNGDGYDSQW